MKDRIRTIMEYERLTPSAFADRLQIGRAVISHILNGRNNPSLDVVSRILSHMDYIDPDWLISGKGTMIKSDEAQQNANSQNRISLETPKQAKINEPDLFSQNPLDPPRGKDENKYGKETIVDEPKNMPETIIKERVIYEKAPDKKISKIIIYYSDNTFETFNTDNKPL